MLDNRKPSWYEVFRSSGKDAILLSAPIFVDDVNICPLGRLESYLYGNPDRKITDGFFKFPSPGRLSDGLLIEGFLTLTLKRFPRIFVPQEGICHFFACTEAWYARASGDPPPLVLPAFHSNFTRFLLLFFRCSWVLRPAVKFLAGVFVFCCF